MTSQQTTRPTLTRTEAEALAKTVRAHFAKDIRVDHTPEADNAKRELLDAIESYIACGDIERAATLDDAIEWVRADFRQQIERIESL